MDKEIKKKTFTREKTEAQQRMEDNSTEYIYINNLQYGQLGSIINTCIHIILRTRHIKRAHKETNISHNIWHADIKYTFFFQHS